MYGDSDIREGLEALGEITGENLSETVIDEIDYTEYSSTKSIGLNLNIARLESKLAKAETAAEAEAIYKQINELLENTPTLVEEKKVAICSYNIWLAATSGTNHVTLSWDKNPKADSYKVYRAESKSGTYKLIKTTADRTYKDYSGSVEKTYYYKVVPRVLVEDTFVTGNDSNIKSGKAKLARVSTSGITAERRKATVKWKSVKQASGYVIYRSTSKSSGFKAVKTVKKGSALSFTNYKLRSGRNYYFKIRAYKVVNGKRVYGSYSYVKRITVK